MNFNLSIIYLLIWLISKEIFSYDGERIVIFCILTFVIGTYYFSKISIENILNNYVTKLTEQFTVIIKLESELLINLKLLLHNYLILKFKFIKVSTWINLILNNVFLKIFKTKNNFISSLIKDQLIDLIKLNIKLNLININVHLNQVVNKFVLISTNKLKSSLRFIYFNDFLTNKILNQYYNNILLLLINKLNYNYNKINSFFIIYNKFNK